MKTFFQCLTSCALVFAAAAPAFAGEWKIETRVSYQVGVYFGREGTEAKSSLSNYTVAGTTLALPAGALLGNGIALPGADASETAQVDFYRLNPASFNARALPGIFAGAVEQLHLPAAVSDAIALSAKSFLVKEVRIVAKDQAAYAPALSTLPDNPFSLTEQTIYVSTFVSGEGALQAIHDDVKANLAPTTEIGEIVPLPAIPHPQNKGIALMGLFTIRAVHPMTGKHFVLEVIETK